MISPTAAIIAQARVQKPATLNLGARLSAKALQAKNFGIKMLQKPPVAQKSVAQLSTAQPGPRRVSSFVTEFN
jgi:hypothetical protein